MKKGIRLFTALVATFMIAITGAKADDVVTSNVTLGNVTSGLSHGTPVVTLKETKDGIDFYNVKVTVDGNSLTNILAHQPKQNESFSAYKEFTITPTLDDAKAGEKIKVAFNDYGSDVPTLDNINTNLDSAGYPEQDDTAISVGLVTLTYSTDGGKTWKNDLGISTDGATTVESAIRTKTGKTNGELLVYGVDYRFSVYTGTKTVVGYKYTKTNNDPAYAYISLEYDVVMPIYGTLFSNEKVYYPTLESAFNYDKYTIVIGADYDITTDIELPEDKTISVNNGATLTVKNGVKLTNNNSLDVQEGGKIVVETTGTLENKDSLVNYGTIISATEIQNAGHLYNNGTIAGDISVIGEESELYNDDDGAITGNVTNTGMVYNYGKVTGDLISDGEVYDAGEITGDIKDTAGHIYHFINVAENETGMIYAPYNMSTVGSTVVLLVYEDEGYELSTLKVTYQKDGKTVEVAVNKETTESGFVYYTFEMPDTDVEVTGSFVEIQNPNTVDGISTYYVSGIISLFGLAGLTLYSKKRMN